MAFQDTILSDLTTLLADYGSVVTRHRLDGTTTTFTGIFDDSFQAVSPVTLAVELTEPQLACKTADLTDSQHDDFLTINGVDYRVIGNEPDGQGLTQLRLS